LFVAQRYRGQEGAAADAPVFSTLGSNGVNGIVMQDLDANPLDYDTAKYRARREQTSAWLDSTDPDLTAFRRSGGKLVVIIGTDDTIAPSGEQLDYYQSMLDAMGRRTVDGFARLYVLPQTGHGLTGNSAPIDGNGAAVQPTAIPSSTDRFALLRNWVENGKAPGKSEVVTGTAGSRPMCSYPEYPRYVSGAADVAGSYACTAPASRRQGRLAPLLEDPHDPAQEPPLRSVGRRRRHDRHPREPRDRGGRLDRRLGSSVPRRRGRLRPQRGRPGPARPHLPAARRAASRHVEDAPRPP
jgi:hypothetical protein